MIIKTTLVIGCDATDPSANDVTLDLRELLVTKLQSIGRCELVGMIDDGLIVELDLDVADPSVYRVAD